MRAFKIFITMITVTVFQWYQLQDAHPWDKRLTVLMAFALDIVLNFISATKSAVQKQHESWHKHRPESRDTSGIFFTTQREIVCGQLYVAKKKVIHLSLHVRLVPLWNPTIYFAPPTFKFRAYINMTRRTSSDLPSVFYHVQSHTL